MGLKVCCISDTHMSHESLKMPEADILVHAGDFSGLTNINEVIFFNSWLGSLKTKYKKIFVVPGNHEGQIERDYNLAKQLLSNAELLVDNVFEYDGYVIYGSPWTITYGRWFFMKDPPDLESVWKNIPTETDILITHQPPYGVLDTIIETQKTAWGDAVNSFNGGCKFLKREVLDRVKPKLHVFGHLHCDGGKYLKINETMFCNAAMLNDFYMLTRQPQVFEI